MLKNRWRQNPEDYRTKEEYKQARNSFMTAVKQAKRRHWNDFLNNVDHRKVWDLWKVKKYVENKQGNVIPVLRSNNKTAVTDAEKEGLL
jgi:hypothetical protein